MTFVRRAITVQITLGTGDFGDTPGGKADTITVEGLRCAASIMKPGNPQADSAEIRIWGLTRAVMNKITDLGKPISRARNNTVTVLAGDNVSGMAVVYQGVIMTAYGDFNDPPNACLNISSNAFGLIAAKPVTPLSYTGGADVATIMAQIAASMNKGFINWGVSGVVLADQYLSGTAADQYNKVVAATGIGADASGDALEIWPREGVRGGEIPDIGPGSGLVGYPTYCDVGLAVKVFFMFGLRWNGQFNLTTSIDNAKGLWQIQNITYDLASEVPDGPWFIEMTAIRPLSSGGGV